MTRYPVALLIAPGGCGKSVALDHFLAATQQPHVRYRVQPQTTSLLTFLRGLTEALAPLVPGAHLSFAIADEQASTSASPVDDLAAWFLQHVEDTAITIVIDDLQNLEDQRSVNDFLVRVIEGSAPSTRWILAARPQWAFPMPSWLSQGRMDVPLEADDLRFSPPEAAALAHSMGNRASASEIADLLTATAGRAGAVALGLTLGPARPVVARGARAGGEEVFEAFAAALLAGCSERERGFLLKTSLLPELDAALMRAAGWNDGAALLDALSASYGCVFERACEALRYQGAFRGFLLSRLRLRGEPAYREAVDAAARALLACGLVPEALVLLNDVGCIGEVQAILDRHGFELVDKGCADVVEACLSGIDRYGTVGGDELPAVRAAIEMHRARFDTAEAWFRLALARCEDPRRRMEIAYRYALALVRWRRTDATGLLEPYRDDKDAPAGMRARIEATLATAYVLERRFDEARQAIAQALAMLELVADEATRARVLHQAAYVALFSSAPAEAKHLAERAVAIAVEFGLYDVAARACTVLYNVACDVEDDPLMGLRYLDAFADYGMKAASPQLRILALLGSYEIEVERGNIEAILALERTLHSTELVQHIEATSQTVLPGQAMRAAWRGDFALAHRLLAESAARQSEPERRAQRYAEIAIYAAAAGRTDDASAAVAAARAAIGTPSGYAKRWAWTQVHLGLALLMLRQPSAVEEILAALNERVPRDALRMGAFVDVLAALQRWLRGEGGHREVASALERLRRHELGGIALLIEALPVAPGAM